MRTGGGWAPVLVVGLVVVVVSLLLPAGGPAQATLSVTLALGATGLLALRLARDGRIAIAPWWCFVAATGLYAAATAVWWLAPLVTGEDLAAPSPLEAVYFASYGFSIAFLAGLVRARCRDSQDALRATAVAMIDAAILAMAAIALSWPSMIGPNLGHPDLTGLTEVAAVGHPLLTAMMVGLIARLVISSPSARSPAAWLLLLWAGADLGGAVAYGYLVAAGDAFHGHPGSLAWLVSHVALAALARHPDLPRLTESDGSLPLVGWRLWLPLGAVLLPGASALLTGSVLLQLLAGAGMLLVIVRLRLMSGDLAEQRRLAEELAETTRELRYLALHDPLTGLANRALFAEQLDQAWAQQRRHARGLSVLALDLDGFKRVNDTYGHSAGDELLVEAARRLQRTVRDGDTVARLGGDEFTVLLPEASRAEAEVIADRIRTELAAPLDVQGEALAIATSIGIAEAVDRHAHPEELLREADAALYAAKAAGKGRHEVYAPGLERATSVTIEHVAPHEAKAWADYMRELRLEIADRKLTGVIAARTRAPENVHRTFQRVLVAIDHLQDDAATATLVLPARRDVEEFVFHQTAVHHWADALAARGELTVARPADADRFWTHLERVSTAVDA
jgi:diguanylate cyclase (GGDEF)-like protein